MRVCRVTDLPLQDVAAIAHPPEPFTPTRTGDNSALPVAHPKLR
jgi:hypothetical protein